MRLVVPAGARARLLGREPLLVSEPEAGTWLVAEFRPGMTPATVSRPGSELMPEGLAPAGVWVLCREVGDLQGVVRGLADEPHDPVVVRAPAAEETSPAIGSPVSWQAAPLTDDLPRV